MSVEKINFNIKNRVIVIGGFHLVLLIYAIIATIKDMILEEQPVTEHEILYIMCHVFLHLILISLLICGAVRANALMVVPWLIVSFPVFAIVSFYTLKYSSFGFILQLIFNILVISFAWYLWYTVYKFFKSCRISDKRMSRI